MAPMAPMVLLRAEVALLLGLQKEREVPTVQVDRHHPVAQKGQKAAAAVASLPSVPVLILQLAAAEKKSPVVQALAPLFLMAHMEQALPSPPVPVASMEQAFPPVPMAHMEQASRHPLVVRMSPAEPVARHQMARSEPQEPVNMLSFKT